MRISKKSFKIIASSALAVALAVTAIIVPQFASAAEEYNETNPEFLEARINSDVETQYGVPAPYEQTTMFTQESGKYSIATDAYVVWYKTDDVAFLYRKYDMGSTRDDVLTIETTVTSQDVYQNDGTKALYSTASSGLMMRGSVTNSGAAQVYLHTRSTGVDVVFRSANGEETRHSPSGIVPEYPVSLKIEKVGQKYSCYFKNKSMSAYKLIGSFACVMDGPVYAGLASHCSDKNNPIFSKFEGYTAVGSGIPTGADDDGGSGSTKPVIPPLDYEDAPYDETKTLFYETFSDGSMTEGDEAVNNPIWPIADGEIVTNEDNTNRRLLKSYVDSTEYLGDSKSQYWTDYSVSLNYEFSEGINPNGDDTFILWTRFKDIDPYGYYGVGFAIETDITSKDGEALTYDTYLRVYHRARSNKNDAPVVVNANYDKKVAEMKISNQIGTGEHLMRVDCMDNKFTAYIDGVEILTFADETLSPNLRGQIGISTNETEIYLDNIIVTKLDDPYGGDYDNYTGANYDDEIPEYVQEYMDKYQVYY